jgi:hypothetical protein
MRLNIATRRGLLFAGDIQARENAEHTEKVILGVPGAFIVSGAYRPLLPEAGWAGLFQRPPPMPRP